MKSLLLLSIFFSLIAVLTACAPAATPVAPDEPLLTVTDGSTSQVYSLTDIQSLPVTAVDVAGEKISGQFNGVALPTLLDQAGFEPTELITVKVVASDGFSVEYDASLFTRADAVLATTHNEKPLAAADGPLWMIVPGEPGKMQPRSVVRIEVSR